MKWRDNMPNFCYNEVKASKEVLEEIFDNETKKVSFNKLIPMPEELKNTIADGMESLREDLYQFFQGNIKNMERRFDNSNTEIETLPEYANKLVESGVRIDI